MKGTCQICGKEFKLLKNGSIPRHGFRKIRGGYAPQSLGCRGAFKPAAEISVAFAERVLGEVTASQQFEYGKLANAEKGCHEAIVRLAERQDFLVALIARFSKQENSNA